jgi:hypothetical protein
MLCSHSPAVSVLEEAEDGRAAPAPLPLLLLLLLASAIRALTQLLKRCVLCGDACAVLLGIGGALFDSSSSSNCSNDGCGVRLILTVAGFLKCRHADFGWDIFELGIMQ